MFVSDDDVVGCLLELALELLRINYSEIFIFPLFALKNLKILEFEQYIFLKWLASCFTKLPNFPFYFRDVYFLVL